MHPGRHPAQPGDSIRFGSKEHPAAPCLVPFEPRTIVNAGEIKGGDAHVNAALAASVFAGEPSANRDMVVLNAGAGLVVAGLVSDLAAGVHAAAAAIDDGRAAAKLDALVRFTNA